MHAGIGSSAFTLLFLTIHCCHKWTSAQIAMGQSDRTQQELALLGWTVGVRIAYCQQMPVQDMIDPFKESIARMLNRHCRNAAFCGLKKSVTFSKHQVVLLDGYPRREHRTLHFRFFVVLPHDSVPIDTKRLDKPLLSNLILSEMMDSQLAELSHGMGWQVLGHEHYPRFDPTTAFFNRWLLLIGFLAGLCMIFLAYWTTALTSGSSIYGGGWLVRGSSGGKNAALRRTMEIIEEQRYRFALYDSQRGYPPHGGHASTKAVVVYKSNERVKEVQAPPKSLATSYSAPQAVEATRAAPILAMPMESKSREKERPPEEHQAQKLQQQQQQALPQPQGSQRPSSASSKKAVQIEEMPMAEMGQPRGQGDRVVDPATKTSLSNAGSISSRTRRERENEMAEMADVVPEIVVMHAQSSSQESRDTCASDGRRPPPSPRRLSRRISTDDYSKRKKSIFGRGDKRGSQPERQKRWKASSLVLSKFSNVGKK